MWPLSCADPPHPLLSICSAHSQRWRFDVVILGVLVGCGLIRGGARDSTRRLVQELWRVMPDTEDEEGGCFYCTNLTSDDDG